MYQTRFRFVVVRPLVCGFLSSVAISSSGCAQPEHASVTPPSPVNPDKVASVEPGLEDIPPGIKPENVARYVIERGRKRREEAEKPQIKSAFQEMMKIADAHGEYGKMITAAKQHTLDFPDDAAGPFYLGLAEFYQGNFEEAESAWQSAKRLDAGFVQRIAPFQARVERIRKRFPELRLGAIQMVTSDNGAQRTAIYNRGKSLILAKNYKEIERIATVYLKSREVSLDGRSLLDVFLEGVQAPAEATSEDEKELKWRESQSRLEAWVKAVPNSRFARAALVDNETSWAWEIRGGAHADKVTKQQWAGMEKHLARAGKNVAALPQSAFDSPNTCTAVLRWAHLSGSDEQEINQMWKMFESRFPDSLELALVWGLHLLPQWSGEPGDWEKFATSWANRRPGEAGDIRYAQFIAGMHGRFKDGEMWSKSQAQWPRTRKGLQILLKKHPGSVGLGTMLMHMAVEVGDQSTAQEALINVVRNRANSTFFSSPRQFAVQRLDILDLQGKEAR